MGTRSLETAPEKGLHPLDRKSTRLNSSHLGNSYAVFCLKKKPFRTHHSARKRANSLPSRKPITTNYTDRTNENMIHEELGGEIIGAARDFFCNGNRSAS